jgi:hypothetical protein
MSPAFEVVTKIEHGMAAAARRERPLCENGFAPIAGDGGAYVNGMMWTSRGPSRARDRGDCGLIPRLQTR